LSPRHAIVTPDALLRGVQTDEALEGQPSMHGWFGLLATRHPSWQTWQGGVALCAKEVTSRCGGPFALSPAAGF